jgi:hypothetical protein
VSEFTVTEIGIENKKLSAMVHAKAFAKPTVILVLSVSYL